MHSTAASVAPPPKPVVLRARNSRPSTRDSRRATRPEFENLNAWVIQALEQARAGRGPIHRCTGRGGISVGCRVVTVGSPEGIVVLLSAVPGCGDASITHCFDTVATSLYREQLQYIAPERVLWFEHFSCGDLFDGVETLDRVTLRWDSESRRFHAPLWTPIPRIARRSLRRVDPGRDNPAAPD